ncbi:hypothetical protein KPA07_06335 [Corynebacterium aurimucosum]|uniref:hypothetical protein n=1 Tax=Corynebacterium aurimucosum TaxID=169292 RepID=UPI001C0EE21F|nr:hypothetical protein [Corynebacterium aurimucosum]MBU5654530.1 hypothetical protein [Corynebacterium aurimucosum]
MATGAHVGNAWVSVQPETQDFYNKLEKQIRDKFKKNDDPDKQPKFKVRPEIDRDKFAEDLNKQMESADTDKVKVKINPDAEDFRKKLRASVTGMQLTVGVRLSEADKRQVQAQLQALTQDRYVNIRLKDNELSHALQLIKDLEDDDVRKGQHKVKLSLDTEDLEADINKWAKAVTTITFDYDDSEIRDNIAKFSDDVDEIMGDSWDPNKKAYIWDIKPELDKAQVKAAQAELKKLTKDETKTITVKVKRSGEAGQKAIRDELDERTIEKEVHIKTNWDDLNAGLDKQKTVTIRPDLSDYATKKVEDKLDRLTRPRMVEILTGDTRFTGFAEDLGQALQNAWDDLDPTLRLEDVFDDDTVSAIRKRHSGAPMDVRVVNDWFDHDAPIEVTLSKDALDKLQAPDVDAQRPFKVDFPEVQKVYVVNQNTGGAASGGDLADTGASVHQRQPTKVDVADVSTNTPMPTQADADADNAAPVRSSTAPVASNKWDSLVDSLHDEFDALRRERRRDEGSRLRQLEKIQSTLRAQELLERSRAADYLARNESIGQTYRMQVEDIARREEFMQRWKAWAPRDLEHLEEMLTHLRSISGGGSNAGRELRQARRGRVGGTPEESWAEGWRTRRMAQNSLRHADFLAKQQKHFALREMRHDFVQTGRAHPNAYAGAGDRSFEYEKYRLVERQLDAGERSLRKQAELNAEMGKLERTLAKTHEELVNTNLDHLTPLEQELKRRNVEGFAKDPNWKPLTLDDVKRERHGRGPRRLRDMDFDWDLTGPSFFDKAFDTMLKPNRRDGTVGYMAKRLMRDILKPLGLGADAALNFTSNTASQLLGKSGDAVKSGTDTATNIGRGLGRTARDAHGEISSIGTDLVGGPGGDLLGGGGGGKGGGLSKATGAMKRNPYGAILGSVLDVGAKTYGVGMKLGGVGALAGGAGNLVAGSLGMATTALQPFAQALKGIAFAPALLSSLGVAAGTVAMAFKGFGDEDDPGTPNALAMAESFTRLSESMEPLTRQVQDNFWEGWADSFDRVTQNTLPALERSLPEAASGLSELGRAFVDTIGSERVSENIERTVKAAGDGFARMAPGMEDFTDFFVRASAVGAERLLPSLADGFSNLMHSWNKWSQDGRMEQWMDSAVDGFRKIGDFTSTAWQGMSGFFDSVIDGTNAAFGEGGMWGAMMGQLDKFNEWANSAGGSQAISDFFRDSVETTKDIGSTIGDWGKTFVTDTIPAFQDFWKQNGESITNIGNDFIKILGDGMSTLTPIIQGLEPMIDKVADLAERTNELVGGPGSQKWKEKQTGDLGALTERVQAGNNKRAKHLSDKAWGDLGDGPMYGRKGRGREWTMGSETNLAEIEKSLGAATQLQNKLKELSQDPVTLDTQAFREGADELSRTQLYVEALRGGFQNATQSAHATAAVFARLGDSVVDIPDMKTIVVKGEGTEEARSQLQQLGAEVNDLENGNFEIKFPNAMDLLGAIDVLKARKDEIGDVAFQAQGLDDILAKLEGMASKLVTIDVQDGDVDEAVNKLNDLGLKAQNINGQVILDTNAPEVQAALIALDAGKMIDGQFVLNDNINDVMAELLQLDGNSTSSQHNISDNAQQVIADVQALNEENTDSKHQIKDNALAVMASILALDGKQTSSIHTIYTVRSVQTAVQAINAPGLSPLFGATGGRFTGGSFARIPAYAKGDKHKGYRLPSAGPGTEITDGFLALDDTTGMPVARLNKDEWVINAKRSNEYDNTLNAVNSGSPEQVWGAVISDLIRTTKLPGLKQLTQLLDLPGYWGGGKSGGKKKETPAERRERLRQEATAKAYQKVAERAAEKDKDTKPKKKKEPASAGLIAEYERALAREEEIKKLKDEGFARRLVGFKDGKFIYADTDVDHDDAVRAVDRAGLIDEQVGMRAYLDRNDNPNPNTYMALRALENQSVPLTKEQQQVYDAAPGWLQYEFDKRRDLPEHVKQAIITGELLDDPDAPVDLQKALNSQDWIKAAEKILADPKNVNNWLAAGEQIKYPYSQVSRYVTDSYTSEAADMIGLKATKLRDVPLYDMFNPSASAYNEIISDFNKGRRELEGDYRDRYNEERKIKSDVEKEIREKQRAADKAKQQKELYGDAKRLRKAIDSQNKKNDEEMERFNAGMDAVRQHRASVAQAQSVTSTGGVTVNQTIGNIVANSAQDAADRFRRQATVGFENLVGSI